MLNNCEFITECNVKQNRIWGQLSTILGFDYSQKIETVNAAAVKDMYEAVKTVFAQTDITETGCPTYANYT